MTVATRPGPSQLARRHWGAPRTLQHTRVVHRGQRVWVLRTASGELCHLTPDSQGLTPGGITMAHDFAQTTMELLSTAALPTASTSLRPTPQSPHPQRLAQLHTRLAHHPRPDPALPDAASLATALGDHPDRVREVIGRGHGQTPAGDDLILGVLLGHTLTGAARRPWLAAAVAEALPATTATSRHLLNWATRGEFPDVLVDAAAALTGGPGFNHAVDRLLAWGASSGWHVGLGLSRSARPDLLPERNAA
ncbi:MAG: DUF2877 domain-containing protein [Propioniciclava sp.]